MSTSPIQSVAGRRDRIVDARARIVPLLTESDVPGAPADLRVAVLAANAHRPINRLRAMAIAAAVSVAIYPVVLIAVGRPIFAWLSMPGLVASLVVSTVVGGLVQGARVKAHVENAVRMCLSLRICPACGYDMTGLEPAPDGCTACPECGAAWNLSGALKPLEAQGCGRGNTSPTD